MADQIEPNSSDVFVAKGARAFDRFTVSLAALLVAASLLPNGSAASETTGTAASAPDTVEIAGKAAPPPSDVAASAVDLECRRRSPARRRVEPPVQRPPDKGSATTVPEPIRITVACVDGDASTTGTMTGQVASVAPTPAPQGEQTSRLDWNLLVPAALSKLITLVLAIACSILAYAAWRVLRRALAGPAKLPSPPSDPHPETGTFVFQRHWGGFGGSSTGWTVSERLVRVIVGLALAALAVSLGMQLVPQEAGRDDKAKPGPEAPASAAKQGK